MIDNLMEFLFCPSHGVITNLGPWLQISWQLGMIQVRRCYYRLFLTK